MTTPFDGKMPPGYSARKVPGTEILGMRDQYAITDRDHHPIGQMQIDELISLSSHLEYIWWHWEQMRAGKIKYTR